VSLNYRAQNISREVEGQIFSQRGGRSLQGMKENYAIFISHSSLMLGNSIHRCTFIAGEYILNED